MSVGSIREDQDMAHTLSEMVPVVVTLGDTAMRNVPAYVILGNRWNGWECPFFEAETIREQRDMWMRHAVEVNESNESGGDVEYRYGWDDATDLPYADAYWEDGTVDHDVTVDTDADGRALITIGYYAFTWYAVGPEADDN